MPKVGRRVITFVLAAQTAVLTISRHVHNKFDAQLYTREASRGIPQAPFWDRLSVLRSSHNVFIRLPLIWLSIEDILDGQSRLLSGYRRQTYLTSHLSRL